MATTPVARNRRLLVRFARGHLQSINRQFARAAEHGHRDHGKPRSAWDGCDEVFLGPGMIAVPGPQCHGANQRPVFVIERQFDSRQAGLVGLIGDSPRPPLNGQVSSLICAVHADGLQCVGVLACGHC